jgi:hypothetical protein
LSICTPPPPDAEGNPACNYRDGWEADPSGSAINVYYFREPANAASAEEVTADVRLKGDTTASQIAVIDPGQTFHRIQFPGIDKAAVLDVLLNTSAGSVSSSALREASTASQTPAVSIQRAMHGLASRAPRATHNQSGSLRENADPSWAGEQ